jgi:hypothetical protein
MEAGIINFWREPIPFLGEIKDARFMRWLSGIRIGTHKLGLDFQDNVVRRLCDKLIVSSKACFDLSQLEKSQWRRTC